MSSDSTGQPEQPQAGASGPQGAAPAGDHRTDAVLAWIERVFVIALAGYTAWGLLRYAWLTGGTLDGLLTMLDTKWKGVLILSAIVFLRTLKPLVLSAKLKTPFGEVNLPGPPATFAPPQSYPTPELVADVEPQDAQPTQPVREASEP